MSEKDTEMATGEVTVEAKAEQQRLPKAKQGKIIVRNLVFDLREKHLQAAFKRFGTILDLTVPLNPSSNQNRGFAFVEYATRAEANEAITAMNGAKYKGRNLTVEFSVPKGSYEKRVDAIVEHTNMERNEVIKPTSVK